MASVSKCRRGGRAGGLGPGSPWVVGPHGDLCRYGSDEVYKGYFQAGLRHGFGVLESSPQGPCPCKYTGHWERGQRSGYGIQEDSAR